VSRFEFVGIGHLTTADAYLAAQAAARALEHRQLAREALYDRHNTRREDRCETPQDPVMRVMPTVGPGEFEPFLTAREVAERLRTPKTRSAICWTPTTPPTTAVGTLWARCGHDACG
jgi:hypothetical protein